MRDARITSAPGVSGFDGRARGARAWAKEGIAAQIAWRAAAVARSDRDGVLVLPVQDWRPMTMRVCVRAGRAQSEPLPLVASPQEQTVVVK